MKRGEFATPLSVIGWEIWVTLGLSLRCKLRLVLQLSIGVSEGTWVEPTLSISLQCLHYVLKFWRWWLLCCCDVSLVSVTWLPRLFFRRIKGQGTDFSPLELTMQNCDMTAKFYAAYVGRQNDLMAQGQQRQAAKKRKWSKIRRIYIRTFTTNPSLHFPFWG